MFLIKMQQIDKQLSCLQFLQTIYSIQVRKLQIDSYCKQLSCLQSSWREEFIKLKI